MDDRQFTRTQQAILNVLADGLPHARQEIHACLPDELGAMSNIRAHLSNIRKGLRPMGQDIICEWAKRQYCYRQVRLLASAIDGKR